MLADLTNDQRRAVTHEGGPMLVLAGAGSGKTRVLGRRLAWLVDQGVPPGEILALAFNARAADELRSRAEQLIGRSHETLRVMTFHAWGRELLNVHGSERGLATALEAVTEQDRVLLLTARLDALDLRHHDLRRGSHQVIVEMIARIDNCRDHLIDAATYLAWAEASLSGATRPSDRVRAEREVEFARVFGAHDAMLTELGLQDFGAMLADAVTLLRRHPDRAAAVRESTRHILVDEFQDTNHTQSQLLYLAAEGSDSLVVVGDDDQGIYRFRGASTKNILDFRARFPDAPEVRLERNYRSTQPILDAAHAVAAPIVDRADKRLIADTEDRTPAPRLWVATNGTAQAQAVADEILRLHTDDDVALAEQAVLMRAIRTEGQAIVDALEARGIPHQVHGGLNLFDRREVRAALGWIRVAVDPRDSLAHLRVAASILGGVDWASATQAIVRAHRDGESLTFALSGVVDPATAARLEAVGREGALRPVEQLVGAVLNASGLREGAISAGGADGAAQLDSLAKLEDLAAGLLRTRPEFDGPSLVAALDELAKIRISGPVGSVGRRLGVQVMTIHQAKGLEFDAVFVVGLSDRRWPGRDRPRADVPDALLPEVLPKGPEVHEAEARRLAYVALTRARRHLILVADNVGEDQIGRTSRFFEEAHAALGTPELREVADSRESAATEAVGEAREAFELASQLAAQAAANDDAERGTLRDAAVVLAERLIDVRTRAFAGDPPPPVLRLAPPEPKPQDLSPSRVLIYQSCPLQYRFRFVDRIPQPKSVAATIGNAAHRALEAHYRPDGDGGDGERLVRRFIGELLREGVSAEPEAKQALDRARDHLPGYHRRVTAGGARPVAVERPFTLVAGPHVVHGRIDRIDALSGGGYRLIDYKTSAPPQDRIPGTLVLSLYVAGAQAAWNVPTEGATLEYILDGANRTFDPDRAEVAGAVDEARRVGDAIGRERFDPSPGWHCNSCAYALICPAQDR